MPDSVQLQDTFGEIKTAVSEGLAESVAALLLSQPDSVEHHRLVRAYVDDLNRIQSLTFNAASATGYCYICKSYPHRPTPSKQYCSRCGNRP